MKQIFRLLLSTFAISFVLHHIPGIDFHGNFLTAFLISIVFSIMLYLVELMAKAIAAIWTISSFGLALLWIIPLWILGFWILPAVSLLITAQIFPHDLTVAGLIPAAITGLAMTMIFCFAKLLLPDKKFTDK